MSDILLSLRDVHITFPARKNWLGRVTERVHALNGMDLQIRQGETLGIVGESGCGKSTLAQLLMEMLKPSHGECSRPGVARTGANSGMQMVFQDPLSSLDPRTPDYPSGGLSPSPSGSRSITANASGGRWRRNWPYRLASGLSTSTGFPMRFPADNASASPLPAPYRQSRTLSCLMNQLPRWISPCRRRS